MHGDGLVKKGFTLIELSLSIAFIAVLSITIVLIISNTVSSYHRGLTLSKINTVGMDLVDEMRATLQSSPSRSVTDECAKNYPESDSPSSPYQKCLADGARMFVVGMKRADVTIGGETVEGAPVWGTFCTGKYSYIWNSGYFFNSDYTVEDGASRVDFSYRASADTDASITVSEFKLLKVQDDTRAVCASLLKISDNINDNDYDYKENMGNSIVLNALLSEAPVDILANMVSEESDDERTENNLAIYDLSAAAPAASEMANDLFYSVSFILGTVQGGVNVMASGNFCATPNDYSENFDYCAINKFNFAVQATGG